LTVGVYVQVQLPYLAARDFLSGMMRGASVSGSGIVSMTGDGTPNSSARFPVRHDGPGSGRRQPERRTIKCRSGVVKL